MLKPFIKNTLRLLISDNRNIINICYYLADHIKRLFESKCKICFVNDHEHHIIKILKNVEVYFTRLEPQNKSTEYRNCNLKILLNT